MSRAIAVLCLPAMLSMSAVAHAAIQDRPQYRPSTDLTIDINGGTGAMVDAFSGIARGSDLGPDYYQVTSNFQLNAVYQSGVNDANIDTFNEYNLPGSTENLNQWSLHNREMNFPDFEKYVLQIDLDGGVDTYASNTAEVPSSSLQWALTYVEIDNTYYHTILAGTIEGSGANSFLKISPDSKYRSFGEVVNPTETFNQNYITTEILGYGIALDSNGAPTGGTLDVTYVPEPAAFGLLGIGAAAMLLRRRRAN